MSPAQTADGVYSSYDVTPRVGQVRLADIGQRLGVAKNVDRFLKLGEIFGAEQDGGVATVPRDHDPLVLMFDPVDYLGEVVPDGTQRLNAHGHDCGAFTSAGQVGDRRPVDGIGRGSVATCCNATSRFRRSAGFE